MQRVRLLLLPLLYALVLSASVPCAAQVEVGAIQVEADRPGTVLLDGSALGPAPLEIRNVAVGRHLVRVDFEEGFAERHVNVRANQAVSVRLRYPRVLEGARYRRGIHGLLELDTFGLIEFNGGRGAGGHLNVGVNVAFSPRLEFRALMLVGGGPYGETSRERVTGLEVGLRPSLRFNVGPFWSVDVGLRVELLQTWFKRGYCYNGPCRSDDRVSIANLAVGLDISAASFRFGPRKQYELALRGGPLYVPIGKFSVYGQAALSFTVLFLPDDR